MEGVVWGSGNDGGFGWPRTHVFSYVGVSVGRFGEFIRFCRVLSLWTRIGVIFNLVGCFIHFWDEVTLSCCSRVD
jgi:hypothetical protein